ncbi:MAG: AraC family transcriptional regulator [Alphaproteobacteria bacterium]
MRGRFRNHRFPRHSHDGLMLSVIDDGVQRLSYRGATHLGSAGAMVAIPPEEVHAGEPCRDEGWLYRTITIPSSVLKEIGGRESARFHCDTILDDAELKARLGRLFNVFASAPLLEQEEALLATVEHFLSRHARRNKASLSGKTETRAVETAKAYLAARLDVNVRLEDLQRVTGMDRYLLVRCFSQMVGMPPHAWHLQCRLRHGQHLLSRGEPVASVALAAGFADQSHLTRAFKRLNGIPPGRYRRNHLYLAARIGLRCQAPKPTEPDPTCRF